MTLPKTFTLYPGDRFRLAGGAKARVSHSQGSMELEPGVLYAVGPRGRVGPAAAPSYAPRPPRDPVPSEPPREDGDGDDLGDVEAEESDDGDVPVEGTLPTMPRALRPEGERSTRPLLATLTPVVPPVQIRQPGWPAFEAVLDRSSLARRSVVQGGPGARFEVAYTAQVMARAIGPAELFCDVDRLVIRAGHVIVQTDETHKNLEIATPTATIQGKTPLLVEIEAPPGGDTVIRVHRGIARVVNPSPAAGDASVLVAARRSTRVPPGVPPMATVRFDPALALGIFLEGWKAPLPDARLVPTPSEDEELAREVRQDQVPPVVEEAPAATAGPKPRSRLRSQDWLRMKVRARRSPALRRYVQRLRRLEKTRNELNAFVASLPGGKPRNKREALRLTKLRFVHERLRSKLYRNDLLFLNQDRHRLLTDPLVMDEDRKRWREYLYGIPLKLQTRRAIPAALSELARLQATLDSLTGQISSLAGVPGAAATIQALDAQRSQILADMDRRRLQLRELIRIQ